MILLAAVPCVAVAEPRHDLVAGALAKAAIFIVIARAARTWTVAIGRVAARPGIAELARPPRAWALDAPTARSEEPPEGTECVSPCKSRGQPVHKNKNKLSDITHTEVR